MNDDIIEARRADYTGMGNAEARDKDITLLDYHFQFPENIFKSSEDANAKKRVSAPKVAAHIWSYTGFRLGTDDTLWRYHEDGALQGSWTPDGSGYAKGLTSAAARLHFTRTLASDVESMLHARLKVMPLEDAYLDDPDLPSTQQPENLILFRDGALEWDSEELTVRNPRRSDCVTAKLPVNWDSNAECPEIDRWLNSALPDPEQQASLMEVVAQAMAPRLWVKQAVVLVGEKNTGKTLFTAILRALLGARNVAAIEPADLVRNRFLPAELHARLANLVGDMSPRAISDPAKFKAVTGGDLITGERKGRPPFSFVNNALFVCSANELPHTKERSEAFFDRFHIIRFGHQAAQPDPQLRNRLTTPSELAGLARRAVPYLTKLRSQAAFTATDASLREADRYQTEADPVKAWFDSYLRLDGDDDEVLFKSTLFETIRAMTKLDDTDRMLGRRLHELARFSRLNLVSGQITDDDGHRTGVYRNAYLWTDALMKYNELRQPS